MYESDARADKREGYQIRLGSPALRGFKACLTGAQQETVYKLFGRSGGVAASAPILYDAFFNLLVDLTKIASYTKSAPIDRVILRDFFQKPLEAAGKVYFGKKFERYEVVPQQEVKPDKIKVIFADGTDWKLTSGNGFYFLCLVVAVLCTLGILNLLRSPTGRAFVAIRDSEISAQSMGIHLRALQDDVLRDLGRARRARRRAVCAQAELHLARPVQHPAVDRPAADGGDRWAGLGARRFPRRDLPRSRCRSSSRWCKDWLPAVIGQAPGLQGLVYGLVLIAFVLFEPLGLYGRWLKVRTWLQLFPFYRRGLFKRQKSFTKSDRS